MGQNLPHLVGDSVKTTLIVLKKNNNFSMKHNLLQINRNVLFKNSIKFYIVEDLKNIF